MNSIQVLSLNWTIEIKRSLRQIFNSFTKDNKNGIKTAFFVNVVCSYKRFKKKISTVLFSQTSKKGKLPVVRNKRTTWWVKLHEQTVLSFTIARCIVISWRRIRLSIWLTICAKIRLSIQTSLGTIEKFLGHQHPLKSLPNKIKTFAEPN